MTFWDGPGGTCDAQIICDECGATAVTRGLRHRWAEVPTGWFARGTSLVCGAICALQRDRKREARS